MGIKQLMHLINDKAPTAVRKIPMENFTGKGYSGQVVACDASMAIYQFLIATQYTYNKGLMMLTDDQGNPTAHLVGLFNRNIQFLENGVKPVWVFDGKPPELKSITLSKRRRLKEDSKEALEKAQEEGNVEDALKHASRSVHVTREITEDAKTLLRLMGLPIIEAPSEAEAQCAALVKAGKAHAVASEDMDSLTFGASYLLRGFNSKKEPITEICLEEVLNKLEMTQDEFIDTCILLGCDYTDHINGIGPGTGYKLIKQHGNLDNAIQHLRNKETSKKYKLPEDFDYVGARELFRNAEVIPPQDVHLSWSPPNEEELTSFLVAQKSFNPARVESGIKKMKSTIGKPAQTRLESFFGKPIKRVSSGGDKPAKKMKTPSRGKSGKK